MDKHFDVLVIGGGMMGLATSLFLSRARKSVCLLERDTIGRHASGVNAGGVRVLNRHFDEIPISMESQQMWRRMKEVVGCDCGYRNSGMVCALETQAECADMEKRQARLQSLGYTYEEFVDQKRVREIIPAVSPNIVAGIYSANDGFALPYKACRAFQNATIDAGTTIYEKTRVVDIEKKADAFYVRTADGRTLKAEKLVNSAGSWGADVAAMAGDAIPITRVAISMTVTARMPRFITPVVAGFHRALSFKQMENGTVVIGGARRAIMRDGLNTRLDTLEMCDSVATAADYFPIMNKATVVRWWAGFEGLSPDKLPIVGPSQKIEGLYHNCGYTTHGFQLSPMMGKLLAQDICGTSPELSLKAFRADRPGLASSGGQGSGKSWN